MNITWTPQTTGLGQHDDLHSIAHGAGLWVAGGGSYYNPLDATPLLITSPDGKEWTQINISDVFPENCIIKAIRYDGVGLWVAISYSFSDPKGTIATSPDGANWTLQTPAVVDRFYDVCYGNGLWIITGQKGTIQTSPDGIEWTERINPTEYELYDVAYNGTDLHAIACYDKIITSPDGIEWTERSFGFRKYPLSIAHNQSDLWVAAGTPGNDRSIAISPDGIEWTEIKSIGISQIDVIRYGAGLWMMGGGLDNIHSSPDGIIWASENPFRAHDLACGSGMWVAVGADGKLMTGEISNHSILTYIICSIILLVTALWWIVL